MRLVTMADETPRSCASARRSITAVEYTPDNGKVDVTLTNDAESIISLTTPANGQGLLVEIALPNAHAAAGT
jgi:hypothetical protein